MITCPYCQHQNPPLALVCSVCSRDIAAPASLLAERDHLIAKRDALRDELDRVHAQIDRHRPPKAKAGGDA